MDRFVLTNERAGDGLGTSWRWAGDELGTSWRAGDELGTSWRQAALSNSGFTACKKNTSQKWIKAALLSAYYFPTIMHVMSQFSALIARYLCKYTDSCRSRSCRSLSPLQV